MYPVDEILDKFALELQKRPEAYRLSYVKSFGFDVETVKTMDVATKMHKYYKTDLGNGLSKNADIPIKKAFDEGKTIGLAAIKRIKFDG